MDYISLADIPAAEDLFGIGRYISGLCSFIAKCPTPMTIAIQGDRGSGKTSIMEMVEQEIDKSKVYSMWFNPWQFSQFDSGDSLSLSFVKSVIDGLGINKTQTDDVRNDLERLGEVMANMGKRAIYVASDLALGSTTTEEIKKKLEKNRADIDIRKTIEHLKDDFPDV